MAIDNEAGWQQRITIIGSNNRDGSYPMIIGTKIENVDGDRFKVTSQAFNPGSGQWIDSIVREITSWHPDKGVVITLYCDDNPLQADGDFNDLIVECTSTDDEMRPPSSPLPRFDLTIPEKYLG
jgi:hypothetical protein